MGTVSEIKLIRTDTTLDLSQKAEKVCSGLEPGTRHCARFWICPSDSFATSLFADLVDLSIFSVPSEYKGYNSKFLSGTTMLKASRVTLRVSARALLVSASSYGIGFMTK